MQNLSQCPLPCPWAPPQGARLRPARTSPQAPVGTGGLPQPSPAPAPAPAASPRSTGAPGPPAARWPFAEPSQVAPFNGVERVS